MWLLAETCGLMNTMAMMAAANIGQIPLANLWHADATRQIWPLRGVARLLLKGTLIYSLSTCHALPSRRRKGPSGGR